MESTPEQRHARLIALVLALVTFALYFPVTGYDFIYFDDPTYVTGNPYITRGLTSTGILWALTTGHGSNWHPLSWMSHMLDVQIYGLQHPGAHHLTSVLFHVANTVLLFVALRRLTGTLWRSAVVAALFAWHPLHVESVAWIAERKDVLSTFFWLLALLTYTRYVRESETQNPQRKVFYAWTLLLFALGLMAKPMLVTLPFVLLLLDYWPLRRASGFASPDIAPGGTTILRKLSWPRLVWEKTPFFALSILSSVVTFLVQKKGGAVMEMDKLPVGLRIGNALLAYVGYLQKTFWPAGLAIFYPLSANPKTLAPKIAAAILLALISVVMLLLARRRAYPLFGWLWFLGTLVPVIGLVQVGSQSMADRYSYMSLVGIFIIVVWGITDLLGQGRLNHPSLAWAILGPVLILCLLVTSHQIPYWKNSQTLFQHDLDVAGNNSIAHINLGTYYEKHDRPADAEPEFFAALSMQPQSPIVLNALGLHFAKLGNSSNAFSFYTAAIHFDPTTSDAHYNLGNLLAGEGELNLAADHYAAALRLEPDSPDAHNNLGAVLVRLGRLPEALDQFKEALRLLPDYPEAQDQMGGVFLKMGHPEVAQLHYEAAIKLKPDFAHAQLKLGLVLAEQNNLQEAIPHLQTALKLESTNADAYFNLAAAYAALNRFSDAALTFSNLLRLNPNDTQARIRLASAQQSAGQSEAAIQNYRAALQVRTNAPDALSGLAWILATNPKPELRNGPEAVQLAERANQLTGQKQIAILSSLDAAYAEAGRFDDAIKIAEQVQSLATAHNQTVLAQKASERLALYHSQKPFHG